MLAGTTALGIAALGLAIAIWAGVGRPDIGRSAPNEGPRTPHLAEGAELPQRQRPPSSGPHYASRASYGVSITPVEPGNWIHAAEHGGVVILFKCGGPDECTAIADRLSSEVYEPARNGRFNERKLVITPYQDMNVPVMAVAWRRLLEMSEIDASQLLAFYDRYLDTGPENAQ
ncbi:MAG: DUF3105 domain-containing protein [Gemmatimonadetes bacterium]|nr:DUF3105 domain-containing protein [Gemmatimonadota bacterium]